MMITDQYRASRGINSALLSAAALALALSSGQTSAEVGPNGEIDGLTAKLVNVNGVQTRYYDYGQGEPLLLVHGGGIGGSSTANNWTRNIPGLAERFRVIAVDRLAQGMTGNPRDDEDFTYRGVVKHMYEFIQTLQLDQVHLVGHSSGGGVMYYLAVERPEIVKTLTIIAHHAGIPPGDGPTKFDAILEECPPDRNSYAHRKCRLLALGHTPETFSADYAAADDFMGNLPASVEGRRRMAAMRAAHPGWPGEENAAYRNQAQQSARNGTLQMPILLYAAMQDTLSWDADEPYAMMRSELGLFNILGAKNPRVQMIIVNEAGHFPYREHPEQFNADLTHFIDFWNSDE